jgi:hypothetical protein
MTRVGRAQRAPPIGRRLNLPHIAAEPQTAWRSSGLLDGAGRPITNRPQVGQPAPQKIVAAREEMDE